MKNKQELETRIHAEKVSLNEKISIFIPSLGGGGAERVMLNLACGFVKCGLEVDLVLVRAEGPYLCEVPPEVHVVDLRARRMPYGLPCLVNYLVRERPTAMLSALDHANLVAIWARWLSGVKTQLVVSVHTTLSKSLANDLSLRMLMPRLIKQFYPFADSVVAVSRGVADDLVSSTGLPAAKVKVIYNPVVTPELFSRAEEPLKHSWFAPGEPPVVLGTGRLTKQKDFSTLIRAFALVRKVRPARLMILGEGEERHELESLVRELGLEADASLPGFVENPYNYMKQAVVFVMSSRREGLPTVLIEALALGTPLVSTDCPSGPAEILEGGKWGRLVPRISGPEFLAFAILEALKNPQKSHQEVAWRRFTLNEVVPAYLRELGIRES